MPRSFADEVVETSNTTGTGTYSLEGPKGSYFPFSASFGTGDKPVYAVRNRQNTKVEYNRGAAFTTGSPATLARAVWKSTNGNAPVPWTADDLPLTIYIPSSAELHEGVVTGWLGAARHALLRAGGQFLTTVVASDVVKSWTHRLATSDSTDTRIGFYDVTAEAYFGDGRRYFQDVGAASKTLDATDIGHVLLFDVSAAARTLVLLPGATAKHGFTCWVLGYGGAANGVVLDPDGSDAIDSAGGGTNVTIPPNRLTRLSWDGAKSQWRTDCQPTAEVDLASAATTDLGSVRSDTIRITGTTAITSLGTAIAGMRKRVRFEGALTLTHNGTSLILPGAGNILTAANDTAEFLSLGGGNWILQSYKRNGVAVGDRIAAAYVTVSGGVATIAKGFGFTSITRTAAGKFTCTMSTAAGDTNYRVQVTIGSPGLNQLGGEDRATGSRTSTVFYVYSGTDNGGNADPASFSVDVYA